MKIFGCFHYHHHQSKKRISIFVALCLFLSTYFFDPYSLVYLQNQQQQQQQQQHHQHRRLRKDFQRSLVVDRLSRQSFFKANLILFYTDFYGTRPWRRVFLRHHLPCLKTIQCELSYDKDRFVDSRAVLFHAPDNPTLEEIKMLYSHPIRSRQIWIFFTMETSLNAYYNKDILSMFNWTMSYRLKSDIRFSYGYYNPKLEPISNSTDATGHIINYAENKTGQIAWLVSNCGQRRDLLVKKLTTVLKVHVGGKCKYKYKEKIEQCVGGRLCNQTLRKYKFYLAFENSFCSDYVTEKYWLLPLENNMIPIVLGGANYKDPRLAIPGSFINVFDFKNPKQLIEYIQKVDSNDTLFNSYFAWKKKYMFSSEAFECHPAIYDICSKIKDHSTGGAQMKRKRNLTDILEDKEHCYAREWLFKIWLSAQ